MTDYNPATLKLHGFDPHETIIGRSVMDFIHPDDIEKAAKNMQIYNGLENLDS